MSVGWKVDCIDPQDGVVDRRGHDWRPSEPQGAAPFEGSNLMETLGATTTERCDKCRAVRRTWPNGMQTHHAFRVTAGSKERSGVMNSEGQKAIVGWRVQKRAGERLVRLKITAGAEPVEITLNPYQANHLGSVLKHLAWVNAAEEHRVEQGRFE